MRLILIVALAGVALGIAGNTSRRASQPNPTNGPVRALSEVAR
ncbi:hypothetical protein ACQVP2_22465 [Methylobacterium aquaticum]